jgi:hypothetical protein
LNKTAQVIYQELDERLFGQFGHAILTQDKRMRERCTLLDNELDI